MSRSVIAGGGIFGVTAARELRERGWDVVLVDPGPLPHPLAASTDISKVVRLAYGSDETYTEMMEEALSIWREWNGRWPEPLFHETGILSLTRGPMRPGGFEHESFRVLETRGKQPERLAPADLRRRFPAWKAQTYTDGFYQREGGYAESGRVVARLVELARAEGVEIRPETSLREISESGGRVTGLIGGNGEKIAADRVVVAAGAWTPKLVPRLAGSLRATAHPIYHFRPPSRRLYLEGLFPVFTADISNTGWYGFPMNRDGIVKIANHGMGQEKDPAGPRDPDSAQAQAQESSLRLFLEETFPTLAPLPIAERRTCFYCDTRDEHFWIDRDPDAAGLVVASGDSGHAFKFAPLLGRLIADVVEERPSPLHHRFRWRLEDRAARGQEESRHHL